MDRIRIDEPFFAGAFTENAGDKYASFVYNHDITALAVCEINFDYSCYNLLACLSLCDKHAAVLGARRFPFLLNGNEPLDFAPRREMNGEPKHLLGLIAQKWESFLGESARLHFCGYENNRTFLIITEKSGLCKRDCRKQRYLDKYVRERAP